MGGTQLIILTLTSYAPTLNIIQLGLVKYYNIGFNQILHVGNYSSVDSTHHLISSEVNVAWQNQEVTGGETKTVKVKESLDLFSLQF